MVLASAGEEVASSA